MLPIKSRQHVPFQQITSAHITCILFLQYLHRHMLTAKMKSTCYIYQQPSTKQEEGLVDTSHHQAQPAQSCLVKSLLQVRGRRIERYATMHLRGIRQEGEKWHSKPHARYQLNVWDKLASLCKQHMKHYYYII